MIFPARRIPWWRITLYSFTFIFLKSSVGDITTACAVFLHCLSFYFSGLWFPPTVCFPFGKWDRVQQELGRSRASRTIGHLQDALIGLLDFRCQKQFIPHGSDCHECVVDDDSLHLFLRFESLDWWTIFMPNHFRYVSESLFFSIFWMWCLVIVKRVLNESICL